MAILHWRGERVPGLLHGFEGSIRMIAGEGVNQAVEFLPKLNGLIAELHVQDAAEIGLPHCRVLCHAGGEFGFAVASGAEESDDDSASFGVLIEQGGMEFCDDRR